METAKAVHTIIETARASAVDMPCEENAQLAFEALESVEPLLRAAPGLYAELEQLAKLTGEAAEFVARFDEVSEEESAMCSELCEAYARADKLLCEHRTAGQGVSTAAAGSDLLAELEHVRDMLSEHVLECGKPGTWATALDDRLAQAATAKAGGIAYG